MQLRSFFSASLPLALITLAACSSDDPGSDASVALDATMGMDSAAPIDTGSIDTGSTMIDSGFADSGVVMNDAEPGDAGMMLTPDLAPGMHVTFAEGRVAIGQTFATVKATLGMPAQRTQAMNNRSYEWNLGGGAEVTIWFANDNLDSDDQPPGEVDDTDTVLWIAVTGTFAGRTANGIGLGSTKTEVETAFGMSPNTIPVTDPPGTIESYYTQGFLVAYNPNDAVRTFTVSRDYLREPNGEIDMTNGELDFGGGTVIRTGPVFPGSGTSMDQVRMMLGEPDVEGEVSFGMGGQSLMLRLFSYSFIGIEIFFTYNARTTLFIAVHPPYFGATGNMTPGLGSTRTEFEAHLIQLGFAAGVASTAQPGVFCYKLNDNRAVGATYTSDMPPAVSTIMLGFPLVMRNCP